MNKVLFLFLKKNIIIIILLLLFYYFIIIIFKPHQGFLWGRGGEFRRLPFS